MSEREPVFNAPWPALAIALAIVASFLIQGRIAEPVWLGYALTPSDLFTYGRWEVLFTALFLHGGWIHTLMNAAGGLAFGAPVARLFGLGARGGIVLFLFYLLCGAFSGLGFALVHPEGLNPVIGASGAVSGLMGAASRLIDRRGALGPILGPTPIAMGGAWIVINLVFGLTTLTPGAGGASIAWEAHLVGYFAGLLLVGPVSRLAAARR